MGLIVRERRCVREGALETICGGESKCLCKRGCELKRERAWVWVCNRLCTRVYDRKSGFESMRESVGV